jgi:hypothetical protein
MINKIYKSIHNKYSKIFKFFFFLRYVFAIFIISTSLFISVPKFFDYEKKQEIIKNYLSEHYDLEIIDHKLIEFKIFPLPNLSIEKATLKIKDNPINVESKNINIFLNFQNLYNYKNFHAKKVVLTNSEVAIEINNSKELINYLNKLNKKLEIQSLDLVFEKNGISLIKIKNINFSNYGYQKYHFTGKIFEEEFKASLINNYQTLKFNLLNTGIKTKFEFEKINLNKNLIKGSSKVSLLNNIIKFNFNFDKSKLNILNSNFRNKDLSFSFDSLIKFYPFFSSDSKINVSEINNNIIKKAKLENIISQSEIIKKLNSVININFVDKSYFSNFIKENSINLNFAFGRLIFLSQTQIDGGKANCNGDSLLIEEYPRLNFTCKFNIIDKKKIYKALSISNKTNKQDLIYIDIEGSLNLFNKKVNFKKISTNTNYKAQKEDLEFFKTVFERKLFNESFFDIFEKSKIKNFLLEII